MFLLPDKDFKKTARVATSGFVLLLASMVGACDIRLSGPETMAANYVQALIEQPDDNDLDDNETALLQNRVVIEYARALHVQGVKQKYKTSVLTDNDEIPAEVAVTIVPKRAEGYYEREHTLIVSLQRDEENEWSVLSIKTKH